MYMIYGTGSHLMVIMVDEYSVYEILYNTGPHLMVTARCVIMVDEYSVYEIWYNTILT